MEDQEPRRHDSKAFIIDTTPKHSSFECMLLDKVFYYGMAHICLFCFLGNFIFITTLSKVFFLLTPI